MSADGQSSRSAHIAGGRVRADVPGVDKNYTIEFWFWNGMPSDVHEFTGCLFGRSANKEDESSGDQLGIKGNKTGAGHLFFCSTAFCEMRHWMATRRSNPRLGIT